MQNFNQNIVQNLFVLLSIVFVYLILSVLFYTYRLIKASDKMKSFYKGKLIISIVATVVSIILALVLSFFGAYRSYSIMPTGVLQGGAAPMPMGVINTSVYTGRSDMVRAPYVYYEQLKSDITDTREFIKKSFSATIKTREVEAVARKVEILIESVRGRIDSSNINTDENTYYGPSANFSFVIPKDNLNKFQDELRTYTWARLYSQNISSQNLLGEKQDLEASRKNTNTEIDKITKDKAALKSKYYKDYNILKSQLVAKQAEFAVVKNEELYKSLSSDIDMLNGRISTLIQNFKRDMTALGASLEDQNQIIDNLDVADTKFDNKIETVEGYIYVQSVNAWDILNIYSPVNVIYIIAGILIIAKLYADIKSVKVAESNN